MYSVSIVWSAFATICSVSCSLPLTHAATRSHVKFPVTPTSSNAPLPHLALVYVRTFAML
uniref:Uncharacterized protein n=1 Tax=Anguilla anguilla TaxID=7936 RepID=A0A0E9XAK8_ANGAN